MIMPAYGVPGNGEVDDGITELRPHHVSAFLQYAAQPYFPGEKGNDDEVIMQMEHITGISDQLLSNPDSKVRIVDGADAFCYAGNGCDLLDACNSSLKEEVDGYDAAAMKLYDIRIGETYTVHELIEKGNVDVDLNNWQE